MLSFLRSLDLWGAAALAAVVSAMATFLAARFAPSFVWYVVIGGPLLIAYSIYRGPSWLGAEASGYEAWQMLFLPPLYLAGTIGSLAAVQLYRMLSKTFKELSPDDVSR
jgi:hypothetical protein